MSSNTRSGTSTEHIVSTSHLSTALLAGPYAPPAIRRGDRAFCLFRDTDVIITSWTDARISWPRCRIIDQAGGSGLLVDEELARAVRTESVLAIMHWWGASHTAVFNWRQSLGIGRLDTPGSVRLRDEIAKRNGQMLRGMKLPARLVKQRREQAIRLNLIQFLKGTKREDRPYWTAKELLLLGTGTDEAIAQRLGRTANAVRIKRHRLGISRRR
jgi:hypothetical protein